MYNISKVSSKCSSIIDKFCAKNGFHDSRIIVKWSTVVGNDISYLAYPVKIMATKRNGSIIKILVLHSDDHGLVSNFGMMKGVLLKKITQYIGQDYINDIILK
jgi:hypothetical protein